MAVGALAALVFAFGARRAAAEPPPGFGGAVHLPEDAGAYLMVRPLDLADGFALADLLSGLFPDAAKKLQALRDAGGFYALSRAEFADDGIDPDAPIIASWGLLDPGDWARQAAAAADASLSKKKKPPAPLPVYARHRVVVKTTDAAKFRGYVAALLSALDAEVASPVRGKGDPPTPDWFTLVRSPVVRGGVGLVAKTAGGSVITVRKAGPFAIVDIAEPWPVPSADERRDLPGLLARMIAPPLVSVADGFARGSRRLLAEEASVAVTVKPASLAALLPESDCRQDWSVGGGALVDDATVAASLHPFRSRVLIGFGLTGLGRSRLDGLGADDGLCDPATAAGDAVAAGGLWLAGLETLRAAPRVGPFAGRLPQLLAEMRTCGDLARLIAATRFWPQWIGVALDAAVTDRTGRQVLSATRNLAVVLRTLPDDWSRWAGSALVLGSFPLEAGSDLLSYLELSSTGRPERTRIGGREATFYDLGHGLGFDEAGLERLAGSHYGLALAPRGGGLGWYYKMKPQPARRGARGTLGFFHLNLGRVLSLYAESSDEATRKAVRMAASQLGVLGGNLTLDADLLRLDLGLGAP